MNMLNEIGARNPAIDYTDRPTVKVILQRDDTVLILNNGLLPGGGVDEGETYLQAINRELEEELGATAANIRPIGTVIQYRDFLKKRYIVGGFAADFSAFNKKANPQDEGEAKFTLSWLKKDEALKAIEDSIAAYADVEIRDDSLQGKLFNLRTSRELLLALE